MGGKDSELSQYGRVHVILNTIVIYHTLNYPFQFQFVQTTE